METPSWQADAQICKGRELGWCKNRLLLPKSLCILGEGTMMVLTRLHFFVIKRSNEATLNNAEIIEWKIIDSERPRRHNSAAPLPNLFLEIKGNSNNEGQVLRYFCGTLWQHAEVPWKCVQELTKKTSSGHPGNPDVNSELYRVWDKDGADPQIASAFPFFFFKSFWPDGEGTKSSRGVGVERASVPTQVTYPSFNLLCPEWWCHHEWSQYPVSGLITALCECSSQLSPTPNLAFIASLFIFPVGFWGHSDLIESLQFTWWGYFLSHLPIDSFQSQILVKFCLLRKKIPWFLFIYFCLGENFRLWALIIIWKLLLDRVNSVKT